jgi:hypothetical protein
LLQLARGVASDSEAISEFMNDEKSQRQIQRSLANFFASLAAKPGRPRADRYSKAAAFRVLNPKTQMHRLCVLFDPTYTSMTRSEQSKARDRMRNGVGRILKASAKATD